MITKTMQTKAFEVIHDAETTWWYRGRAHTITRVLNHLLPSKNHGQERIIDIGAGVGAMFPTLAPYGKVTAFEPDPTVRESCITRGYDEVLPTGNLPEVIATHKEQFNLVAVLDVIEHTEDDEAFIAQLNELIAPGGKILITVPAFMFLWSEHDVLNQHYRRYTRAGIVRLLKKQGFTITYASYWNMILFFPAFLVRLVGNPGHAGLNLSPWIDRLFFRCIATESLLMPLLTLPFGTSVIVLAEKK
jgi:2-polyprenyl-3-methyl-5-hydroxy-6-metoxy-1,4-benzoquinol methylase